MDDLDYFFSLDDPNVNLSTPGGVPIDSQQTSPDASDRHETADSRLPLLRACDFDDEKTYDRCNPTCIHYDFEWKILKYGNGRERGTTAGQGREKDLVLAPGDFWKQKFLFQLQELQKEKFPDQDFTCTESYYSITVEKTRQRGLKKTRCEKLDIQWKDIETHLEGLGILFKKRHDMKIIVTIELAYRETTKTSTGVPKPRQTQSEKARNKMKADGAFKGRVFNKYRCRRKCKHGSTHCWVDSQGNHHPLNYVYLRRIVDDLESHLKEGQNFDDVNIDVPIPQSIQKELLESSSSSDCIMGDADEVFDEFSTWILARTQSDRLRAGLEAVIEFMRDGVLNLNHILKEEKFVAKAMQNAKLPLGAIVQLIHDIPEFRKERSRRLQVEIIT